jgi:hypothetical protein
VKQGCCSLVARGLAEVFMVERKLLFDFEKELKDVGYFKDAK